MITILECRVVTEILFTYYIIREASVVNVNGRRRLIQGYNAVKEELSISSLQQGAGYFEGVAHGSVDVEPDPDGFVPGDLGDDTDCGVSKSTNVFHSDWLEPNPVGSAGSSDLPDFPGMSEACGVTGLLHPTGDDSILEGCTDVQYKVLASRSVGGEQVRWSSVQTWILSVGACKMDQHVGLT